MPVTPLVIQLILAAPSAAQEFDATGASIPPDGATVRDPVLGFAGGYTGAPVVQFLSDASTNVLVERRSDGQEFTDVPLVGDLFGAQLMAQTNLTRRVGLGLTLPTWFLSDGTAGGGFTLGDTTVWAPIYVVARGPRLGVIPFVNLPTGAPARFLGDSGLGGGALVSGGLGDGLLFANLDAGLDVAPKTDLPEWPGGLHARYAVDLGISPSDAFAFHTELRSRIPLQSRAPTLPSELMGTVKARLSNRVWANGSLGRALTRGVGAPGLHMLLGISAAPGTRSIEGEIVTGPAPKEVRVTDHRRIPLTGVIVSSGAASVETDGDGFADLPARQVEKTRLISMELPGYERIDLEVDPEIPFWNVTMHRLPVPVAVGVVGPEGPLLEVEVEVEGPYDPGAPRIDEAGVYNWVLGPGEWHVDMSSPGLGSQERTILIDADRADPIRVDALLASLESDKVVTVEVVDRLGRPVEDAVVAVDDRDLGTTGTGGDVVVHGLPEGDQTLTVRSERHGDAAVVAVPVEDGEEGVLQAVLDWQAGSVQVQATDPQGNPVEATVSFQGPASLPPRDVGTDGEELFTLRPGTWEVTVSAPGKGSQTRTVEVDETPGELLVVDVGLIPDEGGTATLELRAVDVVGGPLTGVEVLLDGARLGTTGPEGDLVAMTLDPGSRDLDIQGSLLRRVQEQVTLVSGRQVHEVVMSWVDGATDIWVTDQERRPVSATLGFSGPHEMAPIQTGHDGYERMVLGIGDWSVDVSADRMTPQVRDLRIEADSRRLNTLRVQLAPEAPKIGNITVTVAGPDGEPIDAAVVTLDGEALGDSVEGTLHAEGLLAGPVDVGVAAEGMRPVEVQVEVLDEAGEEGQDTQVQIPMEWAPGALKVEVTDNDGVAVEAQVSVVGPAEVNSRSTVDGQTVIGAEPGEWVVTVEAEGLATQEVTVDLPEAAELTELDVVMAPVQEDTHNLVVTAETPEGAPLVGAEVRVDGEKVGTTSNTGTIEILDFGNQDIVVTITPDVPAYESVEIPVEVQRKTDGEIRHTVVVPHAERQVAIEVQDDQGNEVAAEIVAIGPTKLTEPVPVGPEEDSEIAFKPGVYTVTARTEDGQLATVEVYVEPQSGEAPAPDTWTQPEGAAAPQTAKAPSGPIEVLTGPERTVLASEDEAATIQMVVRPVTSDLQEDQLVPVAPILFDVDRSNLRSDAWPTLRDLASWLAANQSAALLEIGGHTDNSGGISYNQQLSEARAQAVRTALIELGVAPERLRARGFGMSRPASSNQDPESRQRNRRVELVVLEWSR